MTGLLGLEIDEAAHILDEAGRAYKVVSYESRRPYVDADSRRVVRVAELPDGTLELMVSDFKTKV